MNMGNCHLFVSSLLFKINIWWFLVYKYFTSLVKFVSKYSIFFWCYCKWICFLNYILNLLIIVAEKLKWCWVLILSPAALLYFLVLTGFYMCRGQNLCGLLHIRFCCLLRDNDFFSFPIWIPLISSSCLIVWPGISLLCWISGENCIFVLHNLSNIFGLSPWSTVLAVSFQVWLFQAE